ncbi:ribonuclease H1 [Leptodontidium sp. MPI-SDFR-AT-0119]|nr:ribonuclease H1 [Leptodontidium sp. MPI-SDFR-AT-0119]
MVYTMEIYIDGGCRGNGRPDAIGAAAAVFKYRWGRQQAWTRYLESTDEHWNDDPPVTNQRAEMTAVIIALEQALEKYHDLDGTPRIDVKIYTDSKYVIGCMTDWIYKWSNNGWINAAGNPVANQDLIRVASDLDDRLKEEGSVKYIWIPRADNQDADDACNDRMDQGQ